MQIIKKWGRLVDAHISFSKRPFDYAMVSPHKEIVSLLDIMLRGGVARRSESRCSPRDQVVTKGKRRMSKLARERSGQERSSI